MTTEQDAHQENGERHGRIHKDLKALCRLRVISVSSVGSYRMLTVRISPDEMPLAALVALRAPAEEPADDPSPKHFQNLRVSSAAALATVVPSGDWARWSTREVCPFISATFAMVGYFHRQSWF